VVLFSDGSTKVAAIKQQIMPRLSRAINHVAVHSFFNIKANNAELLDRVGSASVG